MFFDSWLFLLKIIVSASLTYLGLIIILRTFGKRVLTSLNAFDFIVTVAQGSVLASAILNKNITVTEGVTALLVLVSLQFLVSWLNVRSGFFRKLIKSEPQFLFFKGEFKHRAMKSERIHKEELQQAARNQGLLSFEQIEAIVLETNGKLSVIKKADGVDNSCLESVRRN